MTAENRTPGETRHVHVREVGPRDGFQNEPGTIATADKITLINALFEEATLFVSASETHNKRNLNRAVAETMADVQLMGKRIAAEDLTFCSVIATAFGCPFEGKVGMGRVLDLAEQFAESGRLRSASVTPLACATRRTQETSSEPPSSGSPASR